MVLLVIVTRYVRAVTWATSGGDGCSEDVWVRRHWAVAAAARRKTVAAVAVDGGARDRCTCCCRAPAAAAWCTRRPPAVPDRIV